MKQLPCYVCNAKTGSSILVETTSFNGIDGEDEDLGGFSVPLCERCTSELLQAKIQLELIKVVDADK